ncbi:COG1361 S-layer family protein [Haloferax volcanii]|nr:COG1361 S-layer family protein [Haloferax volcanii]MDW7536294.1 COG1361 S-layer family protein [Haloferax volcanii]
MVAPVVAQTASSGQVYGSPDIDVFTSTSEFEPGTQSQLRLTLQNNGEIDQSGPERYESRVTTARGVTVEARPGDAPVEINTGTIGAGNVPMGTVDLSPIDITVSENATPGTYRIPVEVSYTYTRLVDYDPSGAEYTDNTRTRTHYVTVRVRDQPRFEVVETSSTAQVGNTGDLSVTIENTGTRAATEASVTATSRSDELTFGTGSASSTAQVGRWAVGERRTVNYTVSLAEDATVRGYTVNLDVDYTDTDGIARTSRTLNIGVTAAEEQSFALENVSTNLRVGADGTVSGTVINNGPKRVDDPVLRFSSNNPNINVETSEYALPDLEPGDSADFSYEVGVSDAANANVQQLNLSVAYRNSRGNTRVSDSLTTNAEIAPHRDRFVVEVANNTIEAGSERALRVRVTNNGDEPLTNIEAKAFVSDPLSSGNDEGIISELPPGESEEFTIALSAGANALPKRYPVSFDFQYEMPDGDTEVSQTYTTPIEVIESEGGGLPVGLIVGAVIVIGVLGVFGWRRFNTDE